LKGASVNVPHKGELTIHLYKGEVRNTGTKPLSILLPTGQKKVLSRGESFMVPDHETGDTIDRIFLLYQIEAMIEYADTLKHSHAPWTTCVVVGPRIQKILGDNEDTEGKLSAIRLYHMKVYDRFLFALSEDEPLWTVWTGGVVEERDYQMFTVFTNRAED
jgi:hypothetical protein